MGWTNGKTKYLKPIDSQSSVEVVDSSEKDRIESDPTLQGIFTVDANELNIRTGPGTNYKKQKTLHRNDKVNGYDTCDGWRYVEYQNTWGWMKNQHLKAEVQSAGSETTTANLVPPPEYKDLGEYKVTTKETDLPLRYGPEKSAKVICGMPKGSIVTAHGYLDGWYYVEYNGKEGWAGKDYLTKQSESESDLSESQPEEKLVKPSHEDFIADYMVSSELKLRYGPGDEYGEIGSLSLGSSVSAYGTEDGWYYVYNQDKNLTGWANGKDLKKKEAVSNNNSESVNYSEDSSQLQTDEDAQKLDERSLKSAYSFSKCGRVTWRG